MQVAQKFAGFSLGDSYSLLKACAKKLKEEMVAYKTKFIQGCTDTGYGAETGEMIFDIIEPFSAYCFNKCLVGDTLISSPSGDLSIDEIKKSLERDENVYLYAFELGVPVVDRCEKVIDAGVQEVFEINLDNGSTIQATMRHKFLCADSKYYTLEDIIKYDIEMEEI